MTMRWRKNGLTPEGFTLIEILTAIVIASVIGVAFVTPYFISARAFGPGGPADQGQLSFMTLGQMELFRSELSALSVDQWTSSIISLASASPYRAPDGFADGKPFTVLRRVACFESDLSTTDQSCSSGYALVSVTVAELRSDQSLTLSLVKTREGL